MVGSYEVTRQTILKQVENVIGIFGIRDALRLIVERLFSEHDPQARETARELLRPGAA